MVLLQGVINFLVRIKNLGRCRILIAFHPINKLVGKTRKWMDANIIASPCLLPINKMI
jgi:hypothetical protein